ANAAGKTTTLRVISGLLAPRQGEVHFEGRSIHQIPAYRRVDLGITQVPEGRRLFPFMTVLENLELGAYNPAARAKKAQNLAYTFSLFPNLAGRRDQLAGSLSGGEQQMCAIGRALMANPKLLMLDEPTLGLAPVLVRRIFETIQSINTKGVTILLVEQNVQHSLQIAHRAYVLENGRRVLHGVGKELLKDERLKKAYLGL
ncbi:MAG: ABC transporter ATP-binding protein, partial [Nitrospira sp.]|nr:ABC transporter ATP-binding protein [Nitrospira sp.]